MKKFFMILIASLFASQSFAALTELPQQEADAAISQVKAFLYQYFQTHRNQNCMMPTENALGVLYRIDGRLHSTDFFFQIPAGTTIENRVFTDVQAHQYVISQSIGFRENELSVTLGNLNEVKEINLTVDSGSVSGLKVQCL